MSKDPSRFPHWTCVHYADSTGTPERQAAEMIEFGILLDSLVGRSGGRSLRISVVFVYRSKFVYIHKLYSLVLGVRGIIVIRINKCSVSGFANLHSNIFCYTTSIPVVDTPLYKTRKRKTGTKVTPFLGNVVVLKIFRRPIFTSSRVNVIVTSSIFICICLTAPFTRNKCYKCNRIGERGGWKRVALPRKRMGR